MTLAPSPTRIQALHVVEPTRLIPVVELAPAEFCNPVASRAIPDANASIEARQDYWLRSLAAAGIRGLQPIRPGSHCVHTRRLRGDNLRIVLAKAVEKRGGLADMDDDGWPYLLDGGFAFGTGYREILFEPGCCIDFRDLDAWRSAAERHDAEWEMVWIGHPWISVRYEHPWLVVSDVHESQEPVPRWLVDPDDLKAAVNAAGAELLRFSFDVADALTELKFTGNVGRTSRLIAGLSAE